MKGKNTNVNMPTVVLDFDGVIHSYMTPWKPGDTNDYIPDEPVKGIKEAIKDIRNAGYEVVVVSARCRKPGGIEAIKNYLNKYDIIVDRIIAEKPPAVVYVDDRGICFDGKPENLLHKIKTFVPWNREVDEFNRPSRA